MAEEIPAFEQAKLDSTRASLSIKQSYFAAIFQQLETNTKVKQLSLDFYYEPEVDGDSLQTMLRRNRTVESLQLRNCTPTIMEHALAGLRHNKSVETLMIHCGEMSEINVQSLACLLLFRRKTLKCLAFACVCFQTQVGALWPVLDALERTRNLATFSGCFGISNYCFGMDELARTIRSVPKVSDHLNFELSSLQWSPHSMSNLRHSIRNSSVYEPLNRSNVGSSILPLLQL